MRKSEYADDDVEQLGGIPPHAWYISGPQVAYMKQQERKPITPAQNREAVREIKRIFGMK